MVSRKLIGGFLIALAGWTAAGCGDGNGGNTTPSPVRRVIAQGSFSVEDFFTGIVQGCTNFEFVPFTTSQTGTADVTVQWNSPSNDMDVAVARGTCNCGNIDDCDEVSSSDSATAKPERLSISNLGAGSYTLVIINWGEQNDQGTYEVGLTN
jgi:hypothetical protein